MTTATKSRFTKPVEPKLRKTARKIEPKVEAAHEPELSAAEQATRAYNEAQRQYMEMLGIPSHKRMILASIVRLATFGVSLYWGLQVAGVLMAVAIIFTNSAFIAFCCGLLASFIAIAGSWNVSSAVSDFVATFDIEAARNTGRELRVAAAKRISIVKSWIKRDVEAAHA